MKPLGIGLLLLLLLLSQAVLSSVDPYGSPSRDEDEDDVGEDDRRFVPKPPKDKHSKASIPDDEGGEDDEDGEMPDAGRKLRKQGQPPPPPPSPNSESLVIHLVPHSHVDQGWLKTVDGTEEAVFDILNSVTQHLDLDVKRRFVWAETWYFRRWFDILSNAKRERVKRLVRDGRFEFVGGGLVSAHDEAMSSHRLVVEQFADGHTFLEQTFGIPQPKVAWQIDSFGHSDSTPALLARLGFSVVVLNRVNFRIKQRFRKGQHLEFLWQSPKSGDGLKLGGSGNGGDESRQIFAHLLPASYASPEGHDFEKTGSRQVTAPRGRATKLLQYAKEVSRSFRTHHVMIPWGDDMRFRDAEKQFGNMDKILAEVATENPSVRIQYSTASEYFEHLQRSATSSSLRFPTFAGDFLPYADAGDAYWVGIYSSRASLKRWARVSENHLFSAGFLFSFARAKSSAMGHVPKITSIEQQTGRVVVDEAKPAPSWGMGLHRSLMFAKRQSALVGTHHHAITGQAKDAVAKDYLKRAKASIDASTRVAMESLSVLLTKRRMDSSPTVVHARPALKPWNQATDALLIKEDGKQWPLIFTNEHSSPRREVVQIRLDVANFAVTKRIRVVDHSGQAVVGQVHRALVGGSSKDVDWKTDIILFFLVDVPALGFATYFVSCSSSSDRLVSSQTFVQSVPLTVFHLKRGRISPSHATAANLDGVKISTTLPTETSSGGCYAIDNELVLVEMDCDSGLVKAWVNKKTKKRTLLKQEFRAHESTRSGSALFRPDRLESSLIQFKTQLTVGVVKGPLVQEVQVLADGISQTVRMVRAPTSADVGLEGHVYISSLVAGVNPDVDTVLRYTTDLKTGAAFFTDTPSGALKERKGMPDSPLAANFYPCTTGLMIKGEQRNAAPVVMGLVFSQPVACTGTATMAANGGSEFGVIELVLHRNPTADDGRGLGEGLHDFGVSRLDSLLFLDHTESALQRRPGLVHRIVSAGDYWMAQMDPSSLLHPLLSREVWVAKFHATQSFLHKFPSHALKITSIFPRDETSDEVLFRVESTADTAVQLDLAQAFPPADWLVFGSREFKSKSSNAMSFQASDRSDDFTSSELGGDDKSSAGFVLSEHATKEIDASMEEANSKSGKSGGKKKQKPSASSAAAAAAAAGGSGSSGSAQAGFPGGLLQSCPVLQIKSFATAEATASDFKRGDAKAFSIGLLFLPDDRVTTASGNGSGGGKEGRKKNPLVMPQRPVSGTKRTPVIVDEMEEEEDVPMIHRRHQAADPANSRGKTLANLRAELLAEEKRSAALEVRSQRLQKNVDELLRELSMFQDIDGGLDKKAALEELNRAEEQLLEGNVMLKESKEKAAALQRELVQAEALDDGNGSITSGGNGGKLLGSRRHASYQESSLHGFFAGAGGMLLLVVAFQWVTGRRQNHRQAFVPVGVRYNPPQNNFAIPTKRL
ncbi:hypothetical protein BASA81_001377 [Batrachochytrium salamandrivorans]|nr:hypothetical protein BASA81_001377 [Batrachochytrium salamandrivorans]